MQGNETRVPKIPTGGSKKTDSCEKKTQNLYRTEKGRSMSKAKANDRYHSATNRVHAHVAKPSLVSTQLSLPSQEGPSTSLGSSSSTRGQISEARQSFSSFRGLSQSGETSTSSSLPKSTQCTSFPRQHSSFCPSSKLLLPRANSNPSTLDHPFTPTKGPSSSATMQTSARKQVIEDWKQGFFPTRWDRKNNLGMDKDLETTNQTTNYDSCREARPRRRHCDKAPRQRHSSHESETLLMKRTKSDAIQWTKARNRDPPRKQSVLFKCI